MRNRGEELRSCYISNSLHLEDNYSYTEIVENYESYRKTQKDYSALSQ